ncbi:unnamed protein product [Gadus morhua 'NCC']
MGEQIDGEEWAKLSKEAMSEGTWGRRCMKELEITGHVVGTGQHLRPPWPGEKPGVCTAWARAVLQADPVLCLHTDYVSIFNQPSLFSDRGSGE